MGNRLATFAAISALLLAGVSCTRETPVSGIGGKGDGSLSLHLVIDDTKAEDVNETPAAPTDTLIQIYMADFSGLVREYRSKRIPDRIYLPEDSYRLDILLGPGAKSHVPSWTQKTYRGSAPFSIKAGADTTVKVTASLYNVMTRVYYPDSLGIKTIFGQTFTFMIGMKEGDTGSSVNHTMAREGQVAYHTPQSSDRTLYWTFRGKHQSKGYVYTKSGEIENVSLSTLYTLRPRFTETEGTMDLSLYVDEEVRRIDDIIIFEPVSTGMEPVNGYEVWARHATVRADVDETTYTDPSDILFSYSDDGANWLTAPAERISEGKYGATLNSLQDNTTYRCRLVAGGEVCGDPVTFTTEKAAQLPNWDFESISNDESGKYKSFYDPASSDPERQVKYWDNGNSASAGYGYVISRPSEDVPPDIPSNYSALLETQYAVVKLAAGNLFTGEFAGLDGMNGKVNFGRPWASGSRPAAVRFRYKYEGAVVDKDGKHLAKGEQDIGTVKFAIGTWPSSKYGGSSDCPIQVNTGDDGTIPRGDFANLAETIAHCEFEVRGTTGWQKDSLPITYLDTVTRPTHIVVSVASSKYGDYFEGATGSKLYLDNIELIYE